MLLCIMFYVYGIFMFMLLWYYVYGRYYVFYGIDNRLKRDGYWLPCYL